MNGKVKFFNESKGFGFITGADGKDYFVHQSAIPSGVRLTEGMDVEFEGVQGDRGPKAEKVKVAGAGSATSEDDSSSDEEMEEDSEEESEEDSEEEQE